MQKTEWRHFVKLAGAVIYSVGGSKNRIIFSLVLFTAANLQTAAPVYFSVCTNFAQSSISQVTEKEASVTN